MKILIVILLYFTSCHLHSEIRITENYLNQLDKEVSYEIFSYNDHPFKNLTISEIKNKLFLSPSKTNSTLTIPKGKQILDIPSNFNLIEKYDTCIHPIRTQGKCGSCWAFSASGVLSDRLCISTQGRINTVLSPQDLLSCDKGDQGCDGGSPYNSWRYIQIEGIVTEDCYPYEGISGKIDPECRINQYRCINPNIPYIKYKADGIRQFDTIEDIKSDMFLYGPVQTEFEVYLDFISYKSGIYRKSSNVSIASHIVKVVGWGIESGVSYWIVANSWGTNWGENGYFRIEESNCCNFERNMITGYIN